MPIASPEKYAEMIDAAKNGAFAYPAINVTSSQTLNAAIRGFAEAGSDGIIQVSTGGAAYFSGSSVKDMVAGSLAFAAFAREVAKKHSVNIALHTDHCPQDKLEDFVLPLLDASEAEVKAGRDPIFNSHMWDGSAETLEENLRIGRELLARTHANKQILEVEIGVVGGEEDGVAHEINEKLYTTVADGIATVEALGLGENGRYLTALTFGNVHGVYKPGNVKLRPEILQEIQQAVGEKFGKERPFDLVFHGGSGSAAQEIADSVEYGVVKMNVDTDTQYAFTRPVAGHMFENYDGVLKVDGEVGDKKQYDPRVWGAKAEEAMAARVVQACTELNSAGKSIG
ncbi:class II fructose-bisphosphate aldolase [Micrococcus luteus]|uniref:class II fructose-bisphosphate aldolase n=1 Tax=Micrococcus TaxID=1269 RepID=UPI000450388F|nr:MULTISPECIES: class II fructose-bisphosphate aldolase [Micrococcus]EZP50830.1 Fructose-bisphosphate aldolase, class II [Micrococcus luteus]MCV7537440.1 class II fructose-bisphosphate aldolase [Micrococcus luteus]NNM37985.1 class II fructose-bisphosphate aldolase [Micrococcus luteus]PAL17223.1 class II fructose-bisphosphate aldolase [Micrococcus luteus]QGY91428.1 class II fructose-bisphosphate aldolase [Micrococcus luteus]